MSTSIAFADALPLHYLILFSFSNIPCGTSGILGGPISISIAFAHGLFQLYLVLFTYCRFVSLCTRNPGFHSSNPRSARALRLSRFRPSFRMVLADICGLECRKTSLCAVFAEIVFSPMPNATSNATNRHLSNDMLYFIILTTPCSRLRETLLWITLHCLFDVFDYPDFVRHVCVSPKTKAVNVAVRAVFEIVLKSAFRPSFRIVLADVWLDSRSGWNRFHSIRSQNHDIDIFLNLFDPSRSLRKRRTWVRSRARSLF